jgi:hypothetical protein
LPQGQYYAAIQAIDNSYQSSEFSKEIGFVVGPGVPLVFTGSTNAESATRVTLNAVVSANGAASDVFFEFGPTTNYGFRTLSSSIESNTVNATVSLRALHLLPLNLYHYRAVAVNSFGLALGEDRTFTTRAYEPFSDTPTGVESLSFASISGGDFNNDGFLDFLLPGVETINQRNHLFQNLDLNGFLPETNLLADFTPRTIAWGDYDGDGDLDFVAAGHATSLSKTFLFRNDGAAGFKRIETPFIAFGYLTGPDGAFAWGDYDNDGDLDLFACGGDISGSAQARLYRNDGNDLFVDSGIDFPGVLSGAAAWADYDNDGFTDLIVSGKTTPEQAGTTFLFRNLGSGNFVNVSAELPGFYGGSISWGDFDNDGLLDLLLTGVITNAQESMVFRNAGTNGFSAIDLSPAVASGRIGAWGDFNNDGRLDILMFGSSGSGVFTNSGNGFFDAGANLPKLGTASPALGDFDQDGTLDFLLAGTKSGKLGSTIFFVSRFLNNLAGTNTAPGVPRNLSSDVQGNSAILSWAAAADPDQTNGLSYNIRVGNTPGSQDVMSAQADPFSGKRRLTALGNAGERLTSRLQNLAPGIYYWSVQAIDNSFATSAFAEEHPFTIEATSERQPPLLLAPRQTSEGLFQFTITSTAATVIIDFSDNLIDWQPVGTNTVVNGFSIFTNSALQMQRFFRARLP